MITKDKRAKLMREEKIGKLLWKLALPAIIAMLINAVYNVADTLFIGMLNNTSAIGAISIVFPIFMLIAAFGQLFGIGAASYISRLLGKNYKIQADKTASTTFFTSLFLGVIISILGVIFIKPILNIFGATDSIMIYAQEYGLILFAGSFITIVNMTLNNMIRAEGAAKFSMYSIMLGAGLNILLDPLFIFTFNMGIKGAAVATVLAQSVSFIFLLHYYFSEKSIVNISWNLFSFSKKIYSQVIKIGLATFSKQALASVAVGMINSAASHYGDAAIASIGITLRVITMFLYVLMGYFQGFQPIAGYNYGAKKFNRLQDAIKISLKRTTVFMTISTLFMFLFANQIILLFSNDPDVLSIGTKAIRTIIVFFPFLGFQMLYIVLFQALGKGREAFILSISRQGFFLIPSILILPQIFGLNGVIMSQPIADFFTLITLAKPFPVSVFNVATTFFAIINIYLVSL